MQLQIGDYLIISGKNQYKVGKKSVNKKGELVINSPRFFTKFNEIAKYLIQQKVSESDVNNLKDLAILIDNSAKEMSRQLFKFDMGQMVTFNFCGIKKITGVIYERTNYVDINHKTKTVENVVKNMYGIYGKNGINHAFESELREV